MPFMEVLMITPKEKKENFNDLNAFIECSNTMDDVYKDIDDYTQTEKAIF